MYNYDLISKDEFFKAPVYLKQKKNLKPHQVLSALNEMTGVDFSNITKKSKQILKEYKPFGIKCNKIRIFEDCLRVRDFSFFNCQIEKEGSSIIFKFTDLGEERNHVIINDLTDIYIHKSGLICLNVKGPVFYLDGTRRYENRRTDI